MNKTTQQGITALKAGDKARARQLFETALEENPEDAQAWLWLSGAVNTDEDRIACLRHVLSLAPDHAAARRGLAKLCDRGHAAVQLTEQQAVEPQRSANRGHAASRRPRAAGSVTEEPAAEREPHERPGVIQFTVRPSPIPVVIRGLLQAMVLAAAFALTRTVLAGTGLLAAGVYAALAILAAATGLGLGIQLVRRLFTRYTVTPKQLIVERGILSRERKTMPLQRIQDTATRQSLVERAFGIGDVLVQTASEQGAAVLDDLPRCHVYQEAILKAAEERGERQGSM